MELLYPELSVAALYGEPEHSIAYSYLSSFAYPWEALDGLKDFILALGKDLPPEEYDQRAEGIWIAKTASVAPSACLEGPLIVCPGAQIRHCAFIRGSAIVGADAVVGNSVELKNCILFDSVQVPHFNYVGDSILGYRSHLGAGAVTSNFKINRTNVNISTPQGVIPTGRRKCGAMLGDFAEVGCNSVLNPGTVIGRNTLVYPLSSVRGFIPANHIYKGKADLAKKSDL